MRGSRRPKTATIRQTLQTTFNRYLIIGLFGLSLLVGCGLQKDLRSAPQSESTRSKSSGESQPPNITDRPGVYEPLITS